MLGVGVGSGCGAEPVEARAIWVDVFTGEGSRRIHVYDRGERYDFEVYGETAPQERVRLGPRGRGLVVRAGDYRGAWIGLDDGRRLPLLLPPSMPGAASFQYAERGDALWWLDDLDASLSLVPLAPGLGLERDVDGSMVPLREPLALSWVVSSVDAPVLFARHADGGASFLRYPDEPGDALGIVREATFSAAPLPGAPTQQRSCQSAIDCWTPVGLEPGGELAITTSDRQSWQLFERRAPELAGELALPQPLADAVAGGGLGLLQVIDPWVSVWLGAGQLFRWDRRLDIVDSVPVFAAPPLFWFTVERGRALVLLSTTGPTYQVDAEALSVVSLETTDCALAPGSAPVVSPSGRWAGWTCLDAQPAVGEPDLGATSGVVVRVSGEGLERFVGVPMSTLAIDDDGDLLLYSIESIVTDQVDGVAAASRPRSLFVLSAQGVLTRIDELEPAPTPVLLEAGEPSAYMQGVALD
ncbi:hypothetical protein ENSA5_34520 [Enhygromyxa salina]|uniref:Uncharacterized protein n=2 Tax=Enhygromyxa salina TaxID=215803 RepID=A0A2S9XX51_9BACT|nr:hypothetical protein ENSA5_34520 [Enhygromyxa salina]